VSLECFNKYRYLRYIYI